MLYFSKIRILLVSIATIFFVFIASSNFFESNNSFISKKINLGLDLQGGSYLLLEIDNRPVQLQKLQNTISNIRSFFKKEKIRFSDLRIQKEQIKFVVPQNNIDDVKKLLLDKESEINPYYDQYKSHQFDLTIQDNEFILTLSKYGIIEIKVSSQDQAIEIVRRRVDEIGTNEPNILKEEMIEYLLNFQV